VRQTFTALQSKITMRPERRGQIPTIFQQRSGKKMLPFGNMRQEWNQSTRPERFDALA
jgi:hypothetical protein